MFLDEPGSVASILEKLLEGGDKDEALLAFQVAFDLFENEYQAFLLNVRNRLPEPKFQFSNSQIGQSSSAAQVESNGPNASENGSNSSPQTSVAMDTSEDVHMTDGTVRENTHIVNGKTDEVDTKEVAYTERLAKIKGILSGETSIQLTLQFLYSHNRSDLLILKTIKQSVEMRNSVCHSATIYANALMHAGTTVDTFLRENLDWLSRATNWA